MLRADFSELSHQIKLFIDDPLRSCIYQTAYVNIACLLIATLKVRR